MAPRKRPLKKSAPVAHTYDLRSRAKEKVEAPEPKTRVAARRRTSAKQAGKSKAEPKNCSICLNTERFKMIRKIPCGHAFHVKCMNKWLKSSNSCPICRAPVKKAEQTGEENRPDPESNQEQGDPIMFIRALELLLLISGAAAYNSSDD